MNEENTTVEPVEALSENDKSLIENSKMKKELALANAKHALAQNELADVSAQNIVLQLAVKYGLREGDLIKEDGTIERKKS